MRDFLPDVLGRIAAAALLVALLFGPPSQAVDPGFSGAVQDTLGNVLAEVEVLVIAPAMAAGSVRPVATVRTDSEGKFLIERLEAGAYQIAAIKRGYRTYIGQVDTQVDRWIQLVLQPQSGVSLDAGALPEDSRWGLRLPRRNILRETEPILPAMETSTPRTSNLSALPVRLKVDQLVKVATDLQRAPDDDSVVQGVETRLDVSADLGTRGQVSAEGSRERLSNSKYFDGSAPASRERDVLRVQAFYETSIETRLSAEIDFGRRGASWDPREGYAPALDHEQETWRAALAFEKQLGTASALMLAVGYATSDLRFPGDTAQPLSIGDDSWRNRALDGFGRVTRVGHSGQRQQLDFHVRHLELPSADLRATTDRHAYGFDGQAGWTAAVRAREARDLSDRFSLSYGVGVRHSVETSGISVVTPQLGANWQLESVRMHVLATYFAIEDWGGEQALDNAVSWMPQERIGYEAALEVPLGAGLVLSGSHESVPLIAERVDGGSRDLVSGVGPSYITDGRAERELSRIVLTRESQEWTLFAELAKGEVDGTVAVALPYDLPFQRLSERNLAYHNGRVGFRLVPQGTLVTLELREVQESRKAMPEAESEQRFVEVTLSQDLMRRDDLGRWRFLMGLSMAELTSADPEDLRQIVSTRQLSSTEGRLSAGLSVEF